MSYSTKRRCADHNTIECARCKRRMDNGDSITWTYVSTWGTADTTTSDYGTSDSGPSCGSGGGE